MKTLANTVWAGTMSNYLGLKRPVTIKFHASGKGEIDPQYMTFDYTQDIKDGQVTQFQATASRQDIVDRGVGFLANGVLTGTFTVETVVWGFTASPAP